MALPIGIALLVHVYPQAQRHEYRVQCSNNVLVVSKRCRYEYLMKSNNFQVAVLSTFSFIRTFVRQAICFSYSSLCKLNRVLINTSTHNYFQSDEVLF